VIGEDGRRYGYGYAEGDIVAAGTGTGKYPTDISVVRETHRIAVARDIAEELKKARRKGR